jgi:hypothetical protein
MQKRAVSGFRVWQFGQFKGRTFHPLPPQGVFRNVAGDRETPDGNLIIIAGLASQSGQKISAENFCKSYLEM